jgi:hypothetical protein
MTGQRYATPALDEWHRELVRGQRTTQTLDALWRSACWEQSALNAAALGMHASARKDFLRAAAVLDAALVAAPPSRP